MQVYTAATTANIAWSQAVLVLLFETLKNQPNIWLYIVYHKPN